MNDDVKNVLKGNFEAKQKVAPKDESGEDVEDRYEREAAKRLGGSIAYVAKKRVMWDDKD